MSLRRIVLTLCLLSASTSLCLNAQLGGDVSVAALSQQGTKLEQRDVIFIQQYFSHAPKTYLDDLIKKERLLPPAASAVAQGKAIPRELFPFILDAPPSLNRNLTALPRGLERKMLGSRLLLLNSRLVVQDMVYLPTVVATESRK